jgi:nucleoside-diphosphate-sugar epimerase
LSLTSPIALLGGSGFIGTRLTRLLIDRGIGVRIGDLRRSEEFPEHWIQNDIRDLESLLDVIRGSEVVINLAAEHRDDVRPLSRYYDVNVEGAIQVCKAAQAADIQKIIFTSSVAVYGFQPRPVGESGPFDPFNEYGRTKFQAEAVYQSWAAQDPSRTLVIVRPTVVFGEGNRGNVFNLLQQIASGRFVMVGSGRNVKSMAYVGNVAAFLAHALSFPPGVHIFNYVDGPDMATNELVAYIRKCLGKSGGLPRIPMPAALAAGHILDAAARISNQKFSISAIRVRKFCESTQFRADRLQNSGFIPPFSLREGLDRTIQSEFR